MNQDDTFEDIKERIEIGLSNNFPAQARLIILGEIFCSVTHRHITIKQGRELEALLGLKDLMPDYDQIRSLGFVGELHSV